MTNYDKTEDFREAVIHCRNEFPDAPIYLMGISMGAMNIQRYLIDYSEDPQVVGACTISSPWCSKVSAKKLANCKIFMKFLLMEYKGLIKEHYKHDHYRNLLKEKGICWNRCMQAKSNVDFDAHYGLLDSGLDSLSELYQKMDSYHSIEEVSVPMLSINSLSDLVIESTCAPLKKFPQTERLMHLEVGCGGHIEYFSGIKADMVIFLFSNCIVGF